MAASAEELDDRTAPRATAARPRAAAAVAPRPAATRAAAGTRFTTLDGAMGGSSKLDKLKALQKEGKKGIVVDKTFGMKNKKGKKAQDMAKQIATSKAAAANYDPEKAKREKKNAKIARIEQEMELKALFSEGLSITVKKKDLHKKKTGAESSGGGGGGGAGVHYDDAWAESELAKAGQSAPGGQLTLEQRIEQKRRELAASSKKGTPVTPETFAKWKAAKAAKLLKEKLAAAKAEELKKKGGKSVLSGKDLYALKKDLFVDDAEADDGPIEREKEAADEGYDENGAALDQEESRPVDAAGVEVTIDGAATAVNAALYGGDDGIDDLDDLDDLDDD